MNGHEVLPPLKAEVDWEAAYGRLYEMVEDFAAAFEIDKTTLAAHLGRRNEVLKQGLRQCAAGVASGLLEAGAFRPEQAQTLSTEQAALHLLVVRDWRAFQQLPVPLSLAEAVNGNAVETKG